MAITSESIRQRFQSALEEVGLTDGGQATPGVRAVINPAIAILGSASARLDEVDTNLDVTRASGRFLDRYASLNFVSRSAVSFPRDNTLDNVVINLTDLNGQPVLAQEVTLDAAALIIPRGTEIQGSSRTGSVRITHDAVIPPSGSQARVSVVGTVANVREIPANTLRTVSLDLSTIQNFNINKLNTVRLVAANTKSIQSSGAALSDDTLRAAIVRKGQSRGANSGENSSIGAIQSVLLRMPEVTDTEVEQFSHGTGSFTIWFDPIDLSSPTDGLAVMIENAVRPLVDPGTIVRARSSHLVSIRLILQLTGSRVDDNIRIQFAEATKVMINNLGRGVSLTRTMIQSMASSLQGSPSATIIGCWLDDKPVILSDTIVMARRERLYANRPDSVVVA